MRQSAADEPQCVARKIKACLIFRKMIGSELACLLSMILLVTASDRGVECGQAIETGTGQSTILAGTLLRATTLLREGSYLAVVLDQHLPENEPLETEAMLQHLDTAILVQVNFAIQGRERVVREVQSAIERGHQAETAARRAGVSKLYGEVNGTLTALVLTVDLALESPALPPGTSEKLKSVNILVKQPRRQIETCSANELLAPAGALHA